MERKLPNKTADYVLCQISFEKANDLVSRQIGKQARK